MQKTIIPNTRAALKYLDVECLDPAPFNPISRTTQKAISGLLKDVQRRGYILNPLHVINDGKGHRKVPLIDGHRRRECAIQLGFKQVPVLIHPKEDPYQLWVDLNRSARTITALDYMEGWYLSNGKLGEHIPKKYLASINRCFSIFGGRTGIRFLVENSTAPGVEKNIIPVHNAFVESGRRAHLKEVGEWVVRHRLQQTLKLLYDYKPSWKGDRGLTRIWERFRDDHGFSMEDILE